MLHRPYEFGGEGSPVHFAVANGFPPATYTPLLQPLTASHRVVSFPPRPLWQPVPPVTSITTWADMAHDYLNALEAHALTDVIGIGHSYGAVATILMALERPQRFRAVVLLDPAIFPRSALRMVQLMNALGRDSRLPLVQKARMRRAQFDTAQDAFAYWRPKPLFTRWTDEQLWRYVNVALIPNPDGGLMLAWSPEWEAWAFRTLYTHSWRKLSALHRTGLPTLLIRGIHSNTFFARTARGVRRVLPRAHYVEVDGDHLFPLSMPETTHPIIADWLRSQGLS
jgi:pimeloyl-ACP methyl ester carboxylesterase